MSRKIKLQQFTWPFEQEWENYKKNAANVVRVSAAFASGTTTTKTAGFEACQVGTIIIATVSGDATVSIVTAINDSTGVITGKQISNAA